MGILGVLLTVIGFPIVSGFLFGKAILDRRINTYHKELRRHHEGELIEYEDVTEEAKEKEVLELKKPLPREEQKNVYDDFFETDDDRD
jgi:hypothetical protein